jgi:pSer/pThr/pTyr-binding forkhead associated (FHA) protein
MEFDESVATPTNTPVLMVILPDGGKERHLLQERETTIGRDPSNHVCLSDHFVSGFHAKIIRSGDALSVVDLGSANKTRVNGRAIVQKAVKCGDEIHFAGVICRLIAPGGTSSDARETYLLSSQPASGSEPASDHSSRVSGSAEWKPPVSKISLLGGIVVLFAVVVALATQVC